MRPILSHQLQAGATGFCACKQTALAEKLVWEQTIAACAHTQCAPRRPQETQSGGFRARRRGAHQRGCDWLYRGSKPVITGASSQRRLCRSRCSRRREVFRSISSPSEKLRPTCASRPPQLRVGRRVAYLQPKHMPCAGTARAPVHAGGEERTGALQAWGRESGTWRARHLHTLCLNRPSACTHPSPLQCQQPLEAHRCMHTMCSPLLSRARAPCGTQHGCQLCCHLHV